MCDCIALRDWIQTSNNGIERLKTGIETIAPVLSGLLIPSQIRLKMSREEKVGVVRSRVVELDCVITRAGNRRGMCAHYFCENPMQLIMNMLQACIINRDFQNSSEFCGHLNIIFVALSGNKSDNDYVFVVRIFNRRKGNAGMHCQMVACLEGLVCEEYTHAKKSVGNLLYPTLPAFQNLLNDNCYPLMFEGMDGENKICTTSVFHASDDKNKIIGYQMFMKGTPMRPGR